MVSLLGLLRANGGKNLMRVVSFGGQDLDGRTLEAVERPWKFNHFGGYRILDEYLLDQVLFIHVWHPGHRGRAQPIRL